MVLHSKADPRPVPEIVARVARHRRVPRCAGSTRPDPDDHPGATRGRRYASLPFLTAPCENVTELSSFFPDVMRRVFCRPRLSGRTRLIAGALPSIAVAVLVLAQALVPGRLLAGTSAAETHVAETMTAMAEIARAVKDGEEGQDAAFRRLLAKDFDTTTIAMASLPSEASGSADAASLARYRSAFIVYLTKAFLEETARSPLYRTSIVGSRVHASGRIIVHTVGEAPNGIRREGDWFVTPGTAPKIVDAAIRGILLSANERKRFALVLAKGGMPALIAALEKGPSGFDASPGEDVWR